MRFIVQASVKVGERFNPAFKFFTFCLHSYVTALGLKFITNKNKKGSVITEDLNGEDLKVLLEEAAEYVLKFEWHDIGRAFTQTK